MNNQVRQSLYDLRSRLIGSSNIRPSTIMTAGLLLVAVASTLLVTALSITTPENILITQNGRELMLASEDSNSFIKYEMESSSTKISGRVLDLNVVSKKKRNLKHAGAHFFLIYLKEEDYQQVVEKYQSIDRCPASFYNRHSRALSIIPASEKLSRHIEDNLAERGTAFSLNGALLKVANGKLNGDDISLPRGRFRFFYLESVS